MRRKKSACGPRCQNSRPISYVKIGDSFKREEDGRIRPVTVLTNALTTAPAAILTIAPSTGPDTAILMQHIRHLEAQITLMCIQQGSQR